MKERRGKFGACLLAQVKRILTIFPSVIAMTVLLSGCMILFGAVFLQSDMYTENKQKVKVALVGDTQDSYLGFGISVLQKFDDSRYAIEFLEMTQEEAVKKLEAGELTAYIVIPDGLFEAVNRGEDVQLMYATVNDASAVASILTSELMDIISDLVTESQNAVYGAGRVLREYQVAADYGEVTDRVYLSLLDMILNRETLYNTLEIGKINGLTLGQYYFCGILIFFLLLWGISSSVLFVKRDMSLTKFWKARGCRVAEQVAAEYLAYLLLMTVSILILFLPVKAILLLLDMELPGFLFLVRMLPAAAVIASLQFLLYELIVDTVSAVLVQFLTGVGLGYLSGCFYPRTFFPESLQKISSFLPTVTALEYAEKCITGVSVVRELGIMALYLLLFLGLAVTVRKWRMQVCLSGRVGKAAEGMGGS